MKEDFLQAYHLSAVRALHEVLSVRGREFFVFVRRHVFPLDTWVKAPSVAWLMELLH